MNNDRLPAPSSSPHVTPGRRPRRWVGYLILVVLLELMLIGMLWGRDPVLVNRILPRYQAWKQARQEARWARHRLPMHRPVPVLKIQGVNGARVPRLGERPLLLLFIGQCQG